METAPDALSGDAPQGRPIAEVAELLGVPMPTLRSWQRRYGIPDMHHTPGRHRRYSLVELHALRLMRDEIARGERAATAAQTVRALLGLDGPAGRLVEGLLAACEDLDSAGVRDRLDDAEAELGLAGALDDVLMPALKQVGAWWESGRCHLGQEQLTTETARAWLDQHYTPSPSRGAQLVLACGPGDMHTIGLEALNLLLRRLGRPTRVLGARTSQTALEVAITANPTAGVVIVSHLASSRNRAVGLLRAVDARGLPVLYAGNAFASPRGRRGLPGTYLGPRLGPASTLINEVVEAAPTPPS